MNFPSPQAVHVLSLAVFLSFAGLPAAAQDANPLAALAGSWNGSGVARFEDGKNERLHCRGYYTLKDGGSRLGLALRCASSSANIDLRAQLQYQAGRVSGVWEERSFNASGNVSGRASNGSMSLAVDGAVPGSISVSFGASSQSVSINTTGSGFKGVTISLRRG